MKVPFQIIYEDNHLLVVNKPAGMLIQGDSTGDKPLVEHAKDYIKQKYNKPGKVFLGVVHRLDRPVSGVVVFARTSKSLERMNKIFHDRKVTKTYWAVVKKRPPKPSDKIISWLIKDEKTNRVTSYPDSLNGGQRSVLSYESMGKLNDHYLLRVLPETGRPHQIRVQLASIKCPIRGDIKYGFPNPNSDGSINLHARELSFIHPVKKERMVFKAALPENRFWEQFLTLEKIKVKDKDIDRLY